jgi:hypothetical protein
MNADQNNCRDKNPRLSAQIRVLEFIFGIPVSDKSYLTALISYDYNLSA